MLDRVARWLLRLAPPAQRARLAFAWRYRRGNIPWDSGVTPPELVAFAGAHPAGRVLDLGCGTGTNLLYLAERGWEGAGVDFVAEAIARAERKAAGRGLPVRFWQGDVTQLSALPLPAPFDLVLDIGCLHSLPRAGHRPYADGVARLTQAGATLLLYAWQPTDSTPGIGPLGLSRDDVVALFAPSFTLKHHEAGHNPSGHPSSWYWLRRR